MSMIKTRWMTITFADGQKLKFKFPVQVKDENVAERLAEVLKQPSLSVSSGDTLYVIPTTAIRCITVTPAPTKLPHTVIRAATRG